MGTQAVSASLHQACAGCKSVCVCTAQALCSVEKKHHVRCCVPALSRETASGDSQYSQCSVVVAPKPKAGSAIGRDLTDTHSAHWETTSRHNRSFIEAGPEHG